MIRIELPYPPTVNTLFANSGKSRKKTLGYKEWIARASIGIKDSHRQNIGPYSLSIAVKRPDMRRRDLGNLEKAISDLLVSHGVIQDDCLCERITMAWDNGISADCVVIIQRAEEGISG